MGESISHICLMATGSVIQPHSTGSDGGTSKIHVVNSSADKTKAIQWRCKRGANPYGPFLEQGATTTGLAPGTYTVNFKMKNTGTGHTRPPNEVATLGANQSESFTVVWT